MINRLRIGHSLLKGKVTLSLVSFLRERIDYTLIVNDNNFVVRPTKVTLKLTKSSGGKLAIKKFWKSTNFINKVNFEVISFGKTLTLSSPYQEVNNNDSSNIIRDSSFCC